MDVRCSESYPWGRLLPGDDSETRITPRRAFEDQRVVDALQEHPEKGARVGKSAFGSHAETSWMHRPTLLRAR